MAVAELPHGTITFLFTDIEGSTRLLKQLGERYGVARADHRRILRAAIAGHDGQEIDTQGDAFFVAFRRAKDAVAAAAHAQRALAAHEWPNGTELRVRMGMHTGEPSVSEDGYLGLGVHRAARICSAGHGGQVLLSQATVALLEDELVDALGPVEVLQLVRAQVAQFDAGKLVVLQQRNRCLREQHLATVTRRANPGGPVHAESEVAVLRDRRFARVHSHAHAQVGAIRPLVRGEGALRVRRRRDRILRSAERDEERIALRIDLLPVVFLERRAQDPMVVCARDRVALTQLLQQTCRALDVREEEGDRPMRELGHSATSVAPASVDA